MNQIDPRPGYEHKGTVNQKVANPFYNFATVEKLPGQLRYQKNVSLASLMRPYPQYGNLTAIDGIEGGNMRYHSFQLRMEKRFAQGYALLFGYNYNRQRSQVFYDTVDSIDQRWTWQKSNRPQHRLSGAGTWEIPLGQGRAYLGAAPRALAAVVGGWELSGIVTWHSGDFMRFGGMVASEDPVISNPTPDRWFDTSVFDKLPAYTRRSNPWQHDGLTGPGLFNLDLSLVKAFAITEKADFVLCLDVFNAVNNMTWAIPNTSVTSSNFGKTTDQLANTFGRRAQLGGRIEF